MMKAVRVLWTELHLESSPMRAACTDRLFQYERTRREDVAIGILVVDCRRRHFRPTVASCHVISNPEPQGHLDEQPSTLNKLLAHRMSYSGYR